MVKNIAYACLLAYAGISHGANLKVSVPQKSYVYGEPIVVTIEANDIKLPLRKINLQPWSGSFYFIEPEIVPTDKKSRQEIRLNLYPKKAGMLVLSPLVLDNYRTDALKINFKRPASITARGNIRTRQVWSSLNIIQREAVRVQFILETRDAFADLLIRDTSPETTPGYQTKVLRTPFTQNGKPHYRYTLTQYFFPRLSGTQKISQGIIEYQVNGKIQYRFATPARTIQVDPTPEYLPPYLPIGKLEMESSVETGQSNWRPLETGRLYYWHIHLRGQNLSPGTLPGILSQIKNNDRLAFLPVESSSHRQEINGRLLEVIHYQVPFTIKSPGRLHMPLLKLQYFDPSSRRLLTRYLDQQPVFALSRWLQIIIALALFSVAGLILVRVYPVMRSTFMRHRAVRRLRRRVQTAQGPQDIREVTREIARLYQWNPNASLTQWQERWNSITRQRAPLDTQLQDLAGLIYANNAGDMEEIQKGFINALQKAPLWLR